LPRVVAVFRAHTAHKTSEFLDLFKQTDVVRLDADRSVGKLDLSWQESRRNRNREDRIESSFCSLPFDMGRILSYKLARCAGAGSC
jgi:hypothetical protein